MNTISKREARFFDDDTYYSMIMAKFQMLDSSIVKKISNAKTIVFDYAKNKFKLGSIKALVDEARESNGNKILNDSQELKVDIKVGENLDLSDSFYVESLKQYLKDYHKIRDLYSHGKGIIDIDNKCVRFVNDSNEEEFSIKMESMEHFVINAHFSHPRLEYSNTRLWNATFKDRRENDKNALLSTYVGHDIKNNRDDMDYESYEYLEKATQLYRRMHDIFSKYEETEIEDEVFLNLKMSSINLSCYNNAIYSQIVGINNKIKGAYNALNKKLGQNEIAIEQSKKSVREKLPGDINKYLINKNKDIIKAIRNGIEHSNVSLSPSFTIKNRADQTVDSFSFECQGSIESFTEIANAISTNYAQPLSEDEYLSELKSILTEDNYKKYLYLAKEVPEILPNNNIEKGGKKR